MKFTATAQINIQRSRENVFDYLVDGSTYPRILLAKWSVQSLSISSHGTNVRGKSVASSCGVFGTRPLID